MAEEIEITKQELDKLKYEVLEQKQDEISEQLGDPGRYFATFKAKDFISHTDTEEINAEKTSIQRTNLLIQKILGEKCNKRGRMNEHPFDVFVAALRRMRVHIHIVKILNNELATKKGELYSSKRTQIKLREFQNGFPSNGVATTRVSHMSNIPQTPATSSMTSTVQSSSDNESSSLVSKGPFPVQSNNSSPISSSSVASSHETTPPILSSPQTDTDGSVLSSPLIPPVVSYTRTSPHNPTDVLPTLPTGFNESGQRLQVNGNNSPQSGGNNTLEQLGDPLPVLPPGFNSEGRKIDDISEFLTPKDPVHPDHGPMPTSSPQSDFNVIQQPHSIDGRDEDTIAELRLMISGLQAEVATSRDRVLEYESEINNLRKWNEELRGDNSKLKTAYSRLESFVRVLTGKDLSDGGPATTPHPKYGNWPGSNRKRNTEPIIHQGYTLTHRQSETSMLNVPTRPNKLPLNMKNGNIRTSNSQPNSYSQDLSPGYPNHYTSLSAQRSPASMDHYSSRGVPKKLSSSRDDLTSGGEDGSSVRSFDSGNSGNVMLANQISATETIV